MSFTVGESVGPYEIIARVGGGGMATIFKAYQKALDRYVAIKVIHPALKDDPSFIARLKREAEIIAKLNHPNIVAVYDFVEFDGMPYVVMQYVDGRTLKDVMQKQKLAVHQILNITRPIADALTYAHWRGILHRDVKPSNVLIDNEGRVYLTDFGLARIVSNSESTLSQDMLIGSPHYLSPEQAKSETADERSDIYSLGIVLYEMFVGRVPFSGDTPYATVLAQINDQPPAPRSINPRIPPAVEQVLLKTLAKDPGQRYSSMSEMMRALENAAHGPASDDSTNAPLTLVDYQPSPQTTAPAPLSASSSARADSKTRPAKLEPASSARIPFAVLGFGMVALFLVAICAAGFLALRGGTVFGLNPTPPPTFAAIVVPTLLSSPAPVPTERATLAPTPTATVTAIPPASRPTASPTVRPIVIPDAPRGKLAYSIATGDAAELHSIWIANADGTDARQIIDVGMWPSLSPDGKQIAYNRLKDRGIYIANADGTNARKLNLPESCCAQWSPDGKKLVIFQGNLNFLFERFINVVNVDGTGMVELGQGYNPAWSPDGTKIVYSNCQSTQCGLYVMEVSSKSFTAITRDAGANPRWSPDGKRIVYQANDDSGHRQVFGVNVDGSGRKQLTLGKGNEGQAVFSADGNFIYWRSDQDGKSWGIFVMRADGTNPRLIIPNAPPDVNLWARESLSTSP